MIVDRDSILKINVPTSVGKIDFYIKSPARDAHPVGFQMKLLESRNGVNMDESFANGLKDAKVAADKYGVSLQEILQGVMAR